MGPSFDLKEAIKKEANFSYSKSFLGVKNQLNLSNKLKYKISRTALTLFENYIFWSNSLSKIVLKICQFNFRVLVRDMETSYNPFSFDQ